MDTSDDFDSARDYTVTSGDTTLGYMRGDFRQASASILISAGDGEWSSTGRQVADYSHSSTDAARDIFAGSVEDAETIEAK